MRKRRVHVAEVGQAMASGTEPNVLRHGELLLVGMVTRAGYGDIGALWQAFMPVEASVPAAVRGRAYELHVYPEGYACGDPFWLMVAVAVERLEHLPPALFVKPLPAAVYAVFEHRLGDGGFEGANDAIEAWSRSSAYERCAPYDLQVFDQRFRGPEDPASVVEFWIPVRPKPN